jgi:hypothetical protein
VCLFYFTLSLGKTINPSVASPKALGVITNELAGSARHLGRHTGHLGEFPRVLIPSPKRLGGLTNILGTFPGALIPSPKYLGGGITSIVHAPRAFLSLTRCLGGPTITLGEIILACLLPKCVVFELLSGY